MRAISQQVEAASFAWISGVVVDFILSTLALSGSLLDLALDQVSHRDRAFLLGQFSWQGLGDSVYGATLFRLF